MKQYDNIPLKDSLDKQSTNSIRFAFDSFSSTSATNELEKEKWFTQELKYLKSIKNKMFNLTSDIQNIINKFKEKRLYVDKNNENELMITFLNNNHDCRMIKQLRVTS